ncbi:MAG: SCO family protein, partial [Mariprofundaceae bacterium]
LAPRVPPAAPGGDFTLQSAAGAFHLHDLRGKVALVYFGYTHCPDACPMALGVMAAAMRALPPAWAERVAGVFVSLDPERDDPATLRDYAHFFDRRIIGVTGAPDHLARVARAWRVDWHVPAHAPGEDYAVDHSTFIYLVTPDGRVADVFDEKTEPAHLALAIKRWLLVGGARSGR